MHIADLDAGNLGANGIVGGGMGIAVGAALSQQMQNTGKSLSASLEMVRPTRVFPRSSEHGFYLETSGHFLLH